MVCSLKIFRAKIIITTFFCILLNIVPASGIVGGTKVRAGKLTAVVSVRYRGKHYCGGCLFTLLHALTAAHCIFYPWKEGIDKINVFTLYVGSISRRTNGKEYPVKHKDIHPDYEKFSLGSPHDIGLLTLAKIVTEPQNVVPATLPPEDSPLPPGTLGISAGWGSTVVGAPRRPFTLRSLELKVASRSHCNDNNLNLNFEVQFCTERELHKNLDFADCGNPLLNGNVLIGINSFSDCELPATFNNIARLIPYIHKAMERAEKETENCDVSSPESVSYSDGTSDD